MDAMELFILWIIFVVISTIIGSSKGKTGLGFFLGFFLGLFGVIIISLVSKNNKKLEERNIQSGTMKKCPFCAELIKREANICKYCGKEIY